MYKYSILRRPHLEDDASNSLKTVLFNYEVGRGEGARGQIVIKELRFKTGVEYSTMALRARFSTVEPVKKPLYLGTRL